MKPAELDTYPVAYIDGLLARVAELEAENKSLRAAGDALARHVAQDARGQTARRLVEAWAEVSQ